MKDILELAEKLGKTIASSPQAAALRSARTEMDKEKELLEVLKKYQTQAEKIAALEEQNKPIEVSDKHAMQDFHDKLIASPIFKKFTTAQFEYIDMMRKVSDTMRAQLAETEK